MKRKALVLTSIIICSLIVVASISGSGRRWLANLTTSFKVGKPQPTATAPMPMVQGSPDIEQTAFTAHGWSKSIVDSTVSGNITYFDVNGNQTASAAITIYRKYPDLLKIVFDWGGSTEINGVDEKDAWVQGATTISNEDARDIRAFLRIWPERLFISRDSGAPYREIGTHVQDYQPAALDKPRTDLDTLLTFSQVEIEDTIANEKPEIRKVYYSVNSSNSKVTALRYFEPEDPNADLTDPETDRTEIRVEFDNWQTISGVLWPAEITHWYGGKVDFYIKVTGVLTNQNLPNSLFQRP